MSHLRKVYPQLIYCSFKGLPLAVLTSKKLASRRSNPNEWAGAYMDRPYRKPMRAGFLPVIALPAWDVWRQSCVSCVRGKNTTGLAACCQLPLRNKQAFMVGQHMRNKAVTGFQAPPPIDC